MVSYAFEVNVDEARRGTKSVSDAESVHAEIVRRARREGSDAIDVLEGIARDDVIPEIAQLPFKDGQLQSSATFQLKNRLE